MSISFLRGGSVPRLAAGVIPVREGGLAQLRDGGQGIVGPVDRRSGDEDVGPGFSSALDRLRGDAAVDLHAQVEPAVSHKLAGAAILGSIDSMKDWPRIPAPRS